MKKRSFKRFICILALTLVSPTIVASAQDLDTIKEQEQQAQAQDSMLSQTLNDVLNQVNEKYAKVQNLQTDLENSQAQLELYQEQITETKASIEQRRTVINAQLQALQLSGSRDSILEIILNSENLSDLIARSVALNTIRQAQNSKVQLLAEDLDNLSDLEQQQAQTTMHLSETKTNLESQAGELETQIENLRHEVAQNQGILTQLASARQTEEERIANAQAEAEREAALARQREAAEAQPLQEETTPLAPITPTPNTPTTPEEPVASYEPEAPAVAPSTPEETGAGRTMLVEATGYSFREIGLSYFTATGIDLRVNPMVIAVDPRVIPLGSIVEIPGYGVAIAGDTGGAIIGAKIDLHFNTVEEAIQWGRRMVTIRILS